MAKAIEKKFGVQIAYDYDASAFFPKQWLEAPISAEGSQIALTEVERMLPIIDRFLSSYPEAVLKKNLKAIYLLNELKFYGKSYGGTNSNTAIYIRSVGVRKGYTNVFLLQMMHAEFSSVLMRNYPFPKVEWNKINDPDFKYRGTGREMLGEKNLYGRSAELLKQGFIYKYATSSAENDFNGIMRLLFTEREGLRKLESRYPRIKSKVDLTIKFLKSIDREFDLK